MFSTFARRVLANSVSLEIVQRLARRRWIRSAKENVSDDGESSRSLQGLKVYMPEAHYSANRSRTLFFVFVEWLSRTRINHCHEKLLWYTEKPRTVRYRKQAKWNTMRKSGGRNVSSVTDVIVIVDDSDEILMKDKYISESRVKPGTFLFLASYAI